MKIQNQTGAIKFIQNKASALLDYSVLFKFGAKCQPGIVQSSGPKTLGKSRFLLPCTSALHLSKEPKARNSLVHFYTRIYSKINGYENKRIFLRLDKFYPRVSAPGLTLFAWSVLSRAQ